jgi:hypothetical protein
MFKLPAVAFAVVMGFLMSTTITFFVSLIESDFSIQFFTRWIKVWPETYAIAVFAILLYRPLALWLVGLIVKWWQTRHHP